MTIDNLSQRSFHDMGRIVLEGVQEIIGRPGVFAMLNTARVEHVLPVDGLSPINTELSYADLGSLQVALETLYGPRGGRGVALRSGRASFKYLMRQFGDTMGLTALDYRLLPTMSRIKTGLQAIAARLSVLCGTQVDVSDDAGAWYWTIRSCPWCVDRQRSEMTCHFNVGMLQEFLGWASGGRLYSVAETERQAPGEAVCTIRIDKQPFD